MNALLAVLLLMPFQASTPSAAPSVAPSPAPTLSPAWKPIALDKDEYAHYTRRETDSTDSDIIASRQVCDCQPPVMLSMLTAAFKSRPGVSVTVDTISMCGATPRRLIATGLAGLSDTAHNVEVVVFRREPALYMFEYTFRSAAPMPDAEQALAALCPKS